MVITVNIYFPEKEVKEAFKALEKELMTPEGEKKESKPDVKPGSSMKPGGQSPWYVHKVPSYAKASEGYPPSAKSAEAAILQPMINSGIIYAFIHNQASDLLRRRIKFEWVTSAYAQEPGLSDKIADMVKRMPDVVNAYKEMGARIADIDKLRDNGAVGEGNGGMLLVRDEKLLTADQKRLVTAENENRKTVINGMAKAIIRINRAPENEQNLKQVMPQAVEQFASIRRDSARKDWWIQSPDGNWRRK